MHVARLALVLLITCGGWSVHAVTLVPAEQDCAKILERWAEDPDSVPQHLVDACKEQLGAAAPVAAAEPPPADVPDPCTGPGADESVLCWGPWSALAPAAAAPVSALEVPDWPGDCESGNELDSRCVALIELPPPIASCPPGTPCGFATLVDGVTSSADVEQTELVPFDMASDGTSFTVDPGGSRQIDSVAMTTNIQPRPDGYENLRSTGVSGDEQSRLVARIVRDGAGQVELAADVWGHGNRTTGAANSGYFAWGVSTSQSGLSLLNGNGLSVNFSGPMSVDNATTAAMTVNFGSQPTWNGTWTNPAWQFGAGGGVSGVDIISDPGQFTTNVQAGSFVQGALLGEPGRQGIAHIIDVTLIDQRHIKDVGLLREITAVPALGP